MAYHIRVTTVQGAFDGSPYKSIDGIKFRTGKGRNAQTLFDRKEDSISNWCTRGRAEPTSYKSKKALSLIHI